MSTTVPAHDVHPPHGGDVPKRDFLKLVAGAGAVIGLGAIAWPLVDSMNPAGDVLALSSVDVDLKNIPAGMGITAVWRGKPIFVRHRTPEEIKTAETTPLSAMIEPVTDADRVKPGHAQWIVVIGICTHLGCVPLGQQAVRPARRVRRLVLPVPRQPVRRGRARAARPGAAEPVSAALCVRKRHQDQDRLKELEHDWTP